MPAGDPTDGLHRLLGAERSLRESGAVAGDVLVGLDDYWLDLVRLLEAFSYSKERDAAGIEGVRQRMRSNIYDMYLERAARAAG
jgi:thymidylate synthase